MILTCFRAFGVQMLADEGPGWFPEPELKEFYGLGDYQDSILEEKILGHKKNGEEGILISTVPPYVKANAKAKNEEDEEEGGINIIASPADDEKV